MKSSPLFAKAEGGSLSGLRRVAWMTNKEGCSDSCESSQWLTLILYTLHAPSSRKAGTWLFMQISLTNTGKRYNREWIFRHFDYEFVAGNKYAVTGSNGAGKSTLLQVIAGSLIHNEGSINMRLNGRLVPEENCYRHISLAAPYLELIEEMTAYEFLSFHHQFKALAYSKKEILASINLEKAAGKQIRYFSSGMKQRLKLAQAFFCTTPVLLLDEPTTNLDADGVALYHQLIDKNSSGKLVIISSNDPGEYEFCEEVIEIGKYK
ncbi:MAG: ABC transporter ATP-binding protein [Ferruginibacter sp.]